LILISFKKSIRKGFLIFRSAAITPKSITVACLLAGGALFLTRTTSAPIALLGILILGISVVPLVVFLTSPRSENTLPFFPLIGLFYIFFFGAPIFLIPFGIVENNAIVMYGRAFITEVKVEVIALVLAGLTLQLCAFYIFRPYASKYIGRFTAFEPQKGTILFILYLILFAGHALHGLVDSVAALPSIGQFLGPVGFIAIAGIYLQFHQKVLSKFQIILFFLVVIPLEIVVLFQGLLLTNKFALFLVFFVIFLRLKQYKHVVFVGLFLVAIVQSYSFMHTIRHFAEYPAKDYSRFIDRVVTEISKKKSVTSSQKNISTIVHRFSQIWVFHHAYNQTPEPIPYWAGETYLPLITSVIPRVIYPDKPTEKTGNTYGQRYKLLDPRDKNTSVNIPWITELLVNFGVGGVLIGMTFFGLFLAFLDRFFNSRRLSDLEFAVAIGILMPLVRPESNFSVMVGSILPLTICLYIYFKGGIWGLGKLPFRMFKNSSVPTVHS
jgi:hypothetical protein